MYKIESCMYPSMVKKVTRRLSNEQRLKFSNYGNERIRAEPRYNKMMGDRPSCLVKSKV